MAMGRDEDDAYAMSYQAPTGSPCSRPSDEPGTTVVADAKPVLHCYSCCFA